MTQPKEIIMHYRRSTLVLFDLGHFYDAGIEFNLKLSGDDLKRLFEANPDLACDHVKFGDDTEVGDRFFEALVEDITGVSWETVQLEHCKGAYDFVHKKALEKGYTSSKT